MARTFDDRPATREATPLLVGLVGPSGAGKTFSALRLATGVQRVVGGDIYFIDTEARRGLHYAERFTFRHLPFGAPFSPRNTVTFLGSRSLTSTISAPSRRIIKKALPSISKLLTVRCIRSKRV